MKTILSNTPGETAAEAVGPLEWDARHAQMRVLAAEAMADPDFVADLHETMYVFRHVDAEHWPLYEDGAENADACSDSRPLA